MRTAAARGDVEGWRRLFGEFVDHGRRQLEPVSQASLAKLVHEVVRKLLGHWLSIVRPQRLGGFASNMYVGDQEMVAWLSEERSELPALDGLDIAMARETLLALLTSAATMPVSPEGKLPTRVLLDQLGLDAVDVAFCLILYQIQAAPDFQRAVSFALNDFTKKEPDASFLFGMVFGEPGPLWSVGRERLHPGSPLRAHRLIEVPRPDGSSLFEGPVRLSDGLVYFLDGRAGLGPALHGWARLIEPRSPQEVAALIVGLDQAVPDQLIRLIQTDGGAVLTPRVALIGHPDDGRDAIAEVSAAVTSRRLLSVDGRALVGLGLEATLEALIHAATTAKMFEALLFIDVPYRVFSEDLGPHQSPAVSLEAIVKLGELFPAMPLIVGVEEARTEEIGRLRGVVILAVPTPTTPQRGERWQMAFGQLGYPAQDDVVIQEIAARYPLPLRAIDAAAGEVVQRIAMGGWQPADYSRDEMLDEMIIAASRQVKHRMATLAERVAIKMKWKDIVLPNETLEQLMEIITFARYRHQVFDSWGFRKKLPYGRALSALFHGPPGTGKTMVAGVIARDLGQELFRVDLSQITSKWIGETEKNLGRVFDEARRHNAVLLFDEADSMFSKRTEVKSSVDRYANMNVNFLLQAMESFEGVVLLTTNFVNSIDDAFKRRIRFHIEFAFPDEQQRELLWQAMFPPEASLDTDVDFHMLAERFEMSGGYIKEAALRAAFAAAELGQPIGTEILYQAARRVYREMGRLVTE